jgi:NAD(P)-dependent dehydrogenase (short-subunit alcohol dehydrogenase family)
MSAKGIMRRDRLLAGQTLVVIGGSSGIGLETARQACEDGAHVIVTARDPEGVHRVGLELGASIAATPIEHLLVSAPGPYHAPSTDFHVEESWRNVDAHLLLPLQVAQNAARTIRPGGSLLFIGCTRARGSIEGHEFASGLTAALGAMTEKLALELAPIRVNMITAGFVDTPLSAAILGDQIDARREELCSTLPIRRVVGPADVAALAVHLMTNTAVTGATFDIDGGQKLVERGPWGL